MDNLALIEKLRATCMLVSLKTQGKSIEGSHANPVKEIAAAQRTARAALYDRTIPFGERRLFVNVGFSELVNTMGKATLDFRNALARLPEPDRKNFSITSDYEPVPGPDDFGMLPAPVTAMLHKHVLDRNARHWHAGKQDLVIRLFHAATQAHQRVREYHYFDKSASQRSRAVLREVTITDLQTLYRLAVAMHIDDNQMFETLLDELQPISEVAITVLREIPEQREAFIVRTNTAIEILYEHCRPYLFDAKSIETRRRDVQALRGVESAADTDDAGEEG